MKVATSTIALISIASATSGFVLPNNAVVHKSTVSGIHPAGRPSVMQSNVVIGVSALHAAAAAASETTTESVDQQLRKDADVIFAIIDTDGSGEISREEMSNHMSQSGYTQEVIDKIFNKMDTNKDDVISKEEFRRGFVVIAALRSAPGLGNFNAEFVNEIYEDADHVFDSADADGNGEIDEFELKSHLGRMFGKFSEGAVENIFRLLDTDGDKKISKEELRDAFVRYSALRQAIGEGPNFK